ncbi:hypothetical protein ABTY53_12005 [Streptomyces noursei]|uniref:hypothetical protein n=1 Tax=Streptomyces noursei TaxID=1971 RepID=UPI00331FC319
MGDREHGSAVRTWLPGVEVGAGPLTEFVPERAPAVPAAPFPLWLSEAVPDGLHDPHALTLSTVDEAGAPANTASTAGRCA